MTHIGKLLNKAIEIFKEKTNKNDKALKITQTKTKTENIKTNKN